MRLALLAKIKLSEVVVQTLVFYVIWAKSNPSFLTERIVFFTSKVAHDSFLDFGEPILGYTLFQLMLRGWCPLLYLKTSNDHFVSVTSFLFVLF